MKDIVHYNLINKARSSGADALLGDISYEWEVTDQSETRTYLFGLINVVVSQNLVYKAKAYSKTAKLVMDPYKSPEAKKESSPSQS